VAIGSFEIESVESKERLLIVMLKQARLEMGTISPVSTRLQASEVKG
jgi:hypothetical protein